MHLLHLTRALSVVSVQLLMMLWLPGRFEQRNARAVCDDVHCARDAYLDRKFLHLICTRYAPLLYMDKVRCYMTIYICKPAEPSGWN